MSTADWAKLVAQLLAPLGRNWLMPLLIGLAGGCLLAGPIVSDRWGAFEIAGLDFTNLVVLVVVAALVWFLYAALRSWGDARRNRTAGREHEETIKRQFHAERKTLLLLSETLSSDERRFLVSVWRKGRVQVDARRHHTSDSGTATILCARGFLLCPYDHGGIRQYEVHPVAASLLEEAEIEAPRGTEAPAPELMTDSERKRLQSLLSSPSSGHSRPSK